MAYRAVLAVERGVRAARSEGIRAKNGVRRVVGDTDREVTAVERGTGVPIVGHRRGVGGGDLGDRDAYNDR